MNIRKLYFGVFILFLLSSFTVNAQQKEVDEELDEEVDEENYMDDESEFVLDSLKDPDAYKEYTEVEVDCRCKVHLIHDDEYKVIIDEENALKDKFKIRQRGKKIFIRYKRKKYNEKYLLPYANVEFKAPMFTYVKVSGKGIINTNEFIEVYKLILQVEDGAKVNMKTQVSKAIVDVDDYSSVTLEGEIQNLKISTTKKGVFQAEELSTNDVNVNITGSGKVFLGDVGNSVNIKIDGTGDVEYIGNPSKTKVSIEGGGSVRSERVNLN